MNLLSNLFAIDKRANAEIAQLRSELGHFGFQWLAASSLPETLEPELTEAIGVALASNLRKGMPLNFDERSDFYSLPWFRQGWFPSGTSAALQKHIEPATRQIAEHVISQYYKLKIEK